MSNKSAVIAAKLLMFILVATLATTESNAGPTAAKIDILVKKNKSTGKDGTDYDNVSSKFRCEAIVHNKEFRVTFNHLNAELYVFGQDIATKSLKLLDKTEQKIDVLKPGEKASVSGKDIVLQYDDNAMAKFGTKYGGYLFVLKDESGAIIASKTTKNSLLKNYDAVKSAVLNGLVKE